MKSRAFSLIELLVVIAVIALLASILLPAVGIVLESAKSIKCLSNQRQLLIAASSWSNDNDDFLMPAIWARTDLSSAQMLFNDRVANSLLFYDLPEAAFACPSYRGTPIAFNAAYGIGLNQTIPWPGNGPGTSGDNTWNWGASATYYWNRGNTTRNSVRNPTEKILFGDSMGDLLPYWQNGVGVWPMLQARRHRGKANISWIDGHASIEPSDYAQSAITSSSTLTRYFNN